MRLVGIAFRNADDGHHQEKNKDEHADQASAGGSARDAAAAVVRIRIIFAIAVTSCFGHDIDAGDHTNNAHDDADDGKCAHRLSFLERIDLQITNYLIT